MSQNKAPRGAGHLEIGTAPDKPARCGKATGTKPKGHRGENPERRPGHSKGAGAENNSPADLGGKKRVGSEKYAGNGRSVADNGVTTIPSKASGGNRNIPGRAAVQKEKNPSRDAGDKGIIPGRATVQKEKNPSTVAGDKGIIPGRTAGHKKNIPVKVADDKGIIPDRVAASGRTAVDKGNIADRAGRAEVIRTPRTVGSDGSGDLSKLLKTVLEYLRIRSDERSKAARMVNEVVDHLLRSIKKYPGFASIAKLPSGSYYEKVKISEPNEFDVMITVPVERIEYEEIDSEGAFYQVAFKRCAHRNPLASFVSDDGMLSAEKMLSCLRKLIMDAVKSLTGYNIKMERKKSGSPAVTLAIEGDSGWISLDMVLALEVTSQSWPQSTTEGLKIENWLGNKVRSEFRRKPFYLVPKQQPLENTEGVQIESQKEMWRISFSHIEKKMIMNHGSAKICCENKSPKCCRKSCLKLLKNLIEKLKQQHPRILAHVCSYHAKTTLLHACVKRPSDDMWRLEDLADCFLQLLDDFTEHLKSANLPHFFIPTCNLYGPQKFDSRSRKRLLDFIEKERAKNFPIFGVNLQSQ
ncbi:cyclic GMP-AMP synthase-like [Mobula birostris]|uniref:cyclic GMP-AMP synthase-like n=1 Tax=Mobula birostris TaxID=1983395 RepID=UPI003B281208